MLRQMMNRLGKRGAACLWFGFIFVVIGASYLMGSTTPSLQQNLSFLTDIMPLAAWGTVWTLGGIAFLVAAFWKRLRLIAFMLGIAVTLNWSVGIAIQTVFFEHQRGYVSASIYLLFAALIYLISTWEDPQAPD